MMIERLVNFMRERNKREYSAIYDDAPGASGGPLVWIVNKWRDREKRWGFIYIGLAGLSMTGSLLFYKYTGFSLYVYIQHALLGGH